MTKEQAISNFVRIKLEALGYCEQYIAHQLECVERRDFSTAMTDATCSVITSSEFIDKFNL